MREWLRHRPGLERRVFAREPSLESLKTTIHRLRQFLSSAVGGWSSPVGAENPPRFLTAPHTSAPRLRRSRDERPSLSKK